MEQKPKKKGAIIGTIAAVVLCGLPGLCVLCPGGIWAATGTLPYDTSSPYYTLFVPSWVGFVGLCLSIIFIAIPVVIGIVTLGKKKNKAAAEEVLPPSEPLPPAS